MGRALVALAALLALSGCAVSTAAEPGLTAEERAAYQQVMRDNYWEYTGLPDDLRPPDPVIVPVAANDMSRRFVTCMNDAGYDNYLYSDGGYSYSWPETGQPDESKIAEYTCNAAQWTDTEEWYYNTAQLTYLYDYFEQTLVPCLAVRHAEVWGAPSREKFFSEGGWWHPYFSIAQADQERILADAALPVECPPMPPGMEDPGYATLWN